MNAEYLNQTVWARIGPSKIHGVGVIAIREIPKGTLYTDYTVHDVRRGAIPFTLSQKEFEKLLPEIQELILDRTTFNADEDMTFHSPNAEAVLQSFMNHSHAPNTFLGRTTRDIKAEEELTEDFITLTVKGRMHKLNRKHYSSFVQL